MSGIAVSKRMVIPGTPGVGMGLSNDTYTDADGTQLIGQLDKAGWHRRAGAIRIPTMKGYRQ